jgi:hypothetical protein
VVPAKGDDVWRNREDLRDVLICSIDPPGKFRSLSDDFPSEFRLGCQDIDDALHARMLPNGNIEAGVRKYCPREALGDPLIELCRHCRCITLCTCRDPYG